MNLYSSIGKVEFTCGLLKRQIRWELDGVFSISHSILSEAPIYIEARKRLTFAQSLPARQTKFADSTSAVQPRNSNAVTNFDIVYFGTHLS